MKKNNTAEKTALRAEEIAKALKEGTEKSIQSMINEAIRNVVSEGCDEKKDDEGEYEEEDVETVVAPEEDADAQETETEEDGVEAEESAEDDDEWATEYEDHKVGEDDYDFTNMDDDEVLKVYSKLGDDDKIFIKKEDDGAYNVKDEETGAEYVIELNADALEGAEDKEETEEPEGFEIEMGDDEDDSEEGIEIELGDEEGDDEDEDEIQIELDENELHAFTDSYQKDVMPTLKAGDVAKGTAKNGMNAGLPSGTKKPWSGYENKESNLFTKTVNEEEVPMVDGEGEGEVAEGATTVSTQSVAKTTHTPTSEPRAEHKRQVAKLVHNGGKYINEDAVRSLIAKAKAVVAENKQLKENNEKLLESFKSIKKSLTEAAVCNVTLGQIVRLLSENSTTMDEKKSIVERFSNVSTIKESKALYENISRELNGTKTSSVMIEKQISANPSKMLNETTIYQNDNPSLDLMRRMENLYK